MRRLMLLVLAALPTLATAAAPAPRPNILFLLADDQRWDALGCAGNRFVQTPQIDRLAREGIRFRNAFVTTAICAASRASILTGQYERTHRCTFGTPPLAERHVAISYPLQLRNAGYRCGFIGKFGVRTARGATQRMFDTFVPLERTPYFKPQPDGGTRHVDEIAGDRALEFLASCRPDQPFCLSISFNSPHAEDGDPRQYFWPPGLDALYTRATFPVPKTMTPEFFAGLPKFLRESESRVRYRWRFDESAKYQQMVRGYYRMISGVDRIVGRLRAALHKLGLADNTLIVYTSDNGYFLGERGFADKWYLYEPSVRVPLVLFDPRRPAERRGKIVDAMALNVDLAPTFLAWSGVPVPAAQQGRSLTPLLDGPTPKDWRTDFLYEHLFVHPRIPKSEGVRTERFSYLRWFEQRPVVEELYDHRADFDEEHNLANDLKHAATLAQLRRRTDELCERYAPATAR